ncbi:hydrogenase nickel incorporation protein HypB [Streptomyces sp. H10-C2]|uniref:hydrogenase nickel incorporation protein HypB n=1 Tax=unclassified Streptomyces TaxID=2593676 RepID=UPI0024B8ED67|nr:MULTISPECIES: hydrogenase nickel incorporation protein HypB [unclassified Streptomyces]MDJ0346477.1 hydrogenase nickel incorporation protein HypB [Streptomyces sp. PH10-H1]MDJ0374989.1 hydrogenase nickel incorporation protein HypB [Streptomyces sp. H10-C2]
MCGTCGCDDEGGGGMGGGTRISVPHDHDVPTRGHVQGDMPLLNGHTHTDSHTHPEGVQREATGDTITLEQKVLAKNEVVAERNRVWLADQGIVAVNLMSSPGAGKTTLLERTIRDFAGRRPVAVIEGDQETMLDADRIKRAGCAVVQVNTGAGCHLDAQMMHGALAALSPEAGSLILVENVGNLVCPALFDLGERSKVVIISVTEGTDKPLKYPYMFAAADLVIINKIDLLPYVDFEADRCEKYARSVNPNVRVLTVSATTGEGVNHWYDWVAEQFEA